MDEATAAPKISCQPARWQWCLGISFAQSSAINMSSGIPTPRTGKHKGSDEQTGNVFCVGGRVSNLLCFDFIQQQQFRILFKWINAYDVSSLQWLFISDMFTYWFQSQPQQDLDNELRFQRVREVDCTRNHNELRCRLCSPLKRVDNYGGQWWTWFFLFHIYVSFFLKNKKEQLHVSELLSASFVGDHNRWRRDPWKVGAEDGPWCNFMSSGRIFFWRLRVKRGRKIRKVSWPGSKWNMLKWLKIKLEIS